MYHNLKPNYTILLPIPIQYTLKIIKNTFENLTSYNLFL